MPEEIEARGEDASCQRCGSELYSDGMCPSCPERDVDETISGDPYFEDVTESAPVTRRYGTCLFTELVDSAALRDRLGDTDGARLFARHNEIFRSLLPQHDGHEQLTRGDGLFATFEHPSDAVSFSLAFHEQVAALNEPEVLQVRIGIHVGDFHVVASDQGGAPTVVGLGVNVAARVVDLARPQQILMTRSVFEEARQHSANDELDGRLRWVSHGAFWLKGVETPTEICEVGREGAAPFDPPSSSSNGRRHIAGSNEDAPGWRPAAGLEVPDRPGFVLRRRLGAGGFGEVWLADKSAGRERAFKFCTRPDRVRALRREVTVFRWLKNQLGERQDIAFLLDWHLETEPYFLESSYAEGGSLVDWAAAQGGLESVPIDTRLDIARQAARAVQAAHSVGVLHKDLKPANVLVTKEQGDGIQVRIADFGLGDILQRERLAADGISMMASAPHSSARQGAATTGSGTIGYMAPEVRLGSKATTQADVYSLGVLLYQLVVGSFKELPEEGWDHNVADPILRDDIRCAIFGDPERRLPSAAELLQRLDSLEQRRQQMEDAARRERDARATMRSQAKRRKQTAAALLLTGVAGTLLLIHQFLAAKNELAQTNLAISRLITQILERELETAMTLVRSGAARADISSNLQSIGELGGGETHSEKREVLDAPSQPLLQRALTLSVGLGIHAEWITSAAVANRQGAMVAHLVREEDGRLAPDPSVLARNYRNRDWFHGTKQGGVAFDAGTDGTLVESIHISEPYVSSAKGNQPKLAISTPVVSSDASGPPLGVLQAAVAIEHLSVWIKDAVHTTSDARIERDVVIVNRAGQIVLHPNPMAELNPMDPLSKEPPRWEAATELLEGVTQGFLDPFLARRFDVSVSKLEVADESFTILVRSPPPAASIWVWVFFVTIFTVQLVWGAVLLIRSIRSSRANRTATP